jgi:hypothetical protein
MKLVMNTPTPPEFFLLGRNRLINSNCSTSIQIINFIVCLLLSLRNPYFNFNMRRSAAKRIYEKNIEGGIISVATFLHDDRCSYESHYEVGIFQRVIVTEVRGSFFHGRYFHVQRVLSMIERDLTVLFPK